MSLLRASSTLVVALLAVSPASGQSGEEIAAIPFESIPGNVRVEAGSPITLDASVTIVESLTTVGSIESQSGGYVFPDGTVQVTASTTEGTTANQGLYGNRIVDMVPPQPFTEVCFKQGQRFVDIHAVSETTVGGACLPGDLGWIIERDQRSSEKWSSARASCLLDGLRLPEPFEWLYSCDEAGDLGLNSMIGDWEWTSNSSIPIIVSASGIAVSTAGLSSCGHGNWGWAGKSDGDENVYSYRCLR